MRRYRLRKWVKNVIVGGITICTFIVITNILNRLNHEFISQCMEQGYTKTYCETKK